MDRDIDTFAERQAPSVSAALLRAARKGGTEADFRREAAKVLENAGLEAGLTLDPRDEYTVARGRVDSLYNRLVLEYKRPTVLRDNNAVKANQSAINQVKDYIIDVGKRERREATRLAGVVTDGFRFIFVRRVGEGWSVDDPLPINASTTQRFLRLLFSLAEGVALIPENLVNDFGPRQLHAQKAVRALYSALEKSKHPLVGKLFDQWRQFFAEATDYQQWAERIESKKEFRTFVRGMGLKIEEAKAANVFFTLHTYYAILIKLIASLAAARFAGGSVAPLTNMAAKEGGELRQAFKELEDGGLFPQYGIRNFLEGDFFGWYIPAWDKDIEKATSSLLQRLSEYDPGTLELAPENARDLLKKLYHYLLPREIRHDLGEYYTPDWLAERLIRQTLGTKDLGDPHKRVLDPACGSGTFLVLLINHIKRVARESKIGPQETLDLIRKNIVGFDLNPLAVIAARTNYLLALGDLIKEAKRLSPDGIDIPIYQCDSVLTPSQGTEIFTSGLYPLRTTVGVFEIPEAFATRERMEVLANLLDDCVSSHFTEEGFLNRLEKATDIFSSEFEKGRNALTRLYQRLRELHEEGLNGVWARIIKNAFAPLFCDIFDFIVGNPPWVNWEHLPDEYRTETVPLWQRYGLFPHSGMDTILGKGKKDISMLMTYVSLHQYLRSKGKLGFVLSQSLFKTSGAGQGFRRFMLPDKTAFAPEMVEDMAKLKPFEGAANRTVVAVFTKGKLVSYPVSYQQWDKKSSGRGSAIEFDTPLDDVTSQKITFRSWFGEPIDKGDLTSSWICASKKALRSIRKIKGRSMYTAHEGSNTGGANAVLWIDVAGNRPQNLLVISNITEGAKRKVPRTQATIEPDLVYPLIRGRDVTRWKATPSARIIMTQDPKTRRGISVKEMERKYTKTLGYLSKFEKTLRQRAAYKRYYRESDPYWSMFNVSDFTFAHWKVVWREVANEIDAAVVGPVTMDGGKKPIIPDHTCILAESRSAEEAHYLCALLNSSPARLTVKNYIILHPDPHVLENVCIPRFKSDDRLHASLSECSLKAHSFAGKDMVPDVTAVEEEIDRLACKVWDLTTEELSEIKRSLEEA